MKSNGWWILLAFFVAAALYVEWHTDEVTVVAAVLLVLGATLGALRPGSAVVGGAVLGFSILAAHAVTEAAGALRPRYQHVPIAPGDWAAMAIVGVVITTVAWGAGRMRASVTGA